MCKGAAGSYHDLSIRPVVKCSGGRCTLISAQILPWIQTMKRSIILTILTILTAVPAMAQKDLSELNGMTDGQVKKTYGQPKEYTANHEYTMSSYFRYDDMEIFYTQSHESIDCFDISSDRVKVLSNFIAGGVRVGDKLSKIQNFDFSKTKYGRNKDGNGLKTTDFAFNILDKYPVNYVIFEEEGTTVYLCVQNGIIKAISFISKDDLPYEGYDVNNHIFAKQ